MYRGDPGAVVRAAMDTKQEIPQEILDAEVLWEVSEPYARAYNVLSKGRGYVMGYGAGGPLPIPYTEMSQYWRDHAEDVLDVEDLDLFVHLVRAQDNKFITTMTKSK